MSVHFEKTKFADEADLPKVARFLNGVFSKISEHEWLLQLRWQYLQNPLGKALYTNAYSTAGELVGHYALMCLPKFTDASLKEAQVFLSLNTAVHTSAQGQGVFQKLANATFDFAQKNFSSPVVLGVANQQSTFGFIQRLGFTSLGQIAVTVRPSNWLKPTNDIKLLNWDEDSLRWRLSSPLQKSLYSVNDNAVRYLKHILGFKLDVVLTNQTKLIELSQNMIGKSSSRSYFCVHAALNASTQTSLALPRFLKPSPLNFIFRCLNVKIGPEVLSQCTSRLFEFIDFDAF